jgi:hypothetical protein
MYLKYKNDNKNNKCIIIIVVIVIIYRNWLSLGGSSPYSSTDKTNKNKYT